MATVHGEVRTALLLIATHKPPGPDGRSNLILKALENILTSILTPLFNACITTSYCLEHFRIGRTLFRITNSLSKKTMEIHAKLDKALSYIRHILHKRGVRVPEVDLN
jgi:hypothetical protein